LVYNSIIPILLGIVSNGRDYSVSYSFLILFLVFTKIKNSKTIN